MSTRVRTSHGGFHGDGFNFGQQFGLKAVARGKPVKDGAPEDRRNTQKNSLRTSATLADGAPISGASVVAKIGGEMGRQKTLRAIKAAERSTRERTPNG
jgi:hypothetical protein